MKRTIILISLVVAVFSKQACATSRSRTLADDTVLKGVRTIYVDPSLQFYVQRALARDLPGVRVVADQKDADATLYVNFQKGMNLTTGSSNGTYETVTGSSNGSATYETHSVSAPVGEEITSHGYSTGTARRPDGRSIVIYEGFADSFTSEFMSAFIRAWRAANPATT
jgi:hypothetical protein